MSHGQGDWVGEASIISNGKSSFALISLVESEILLIPSTAVIRELGLSQEFAHRMLNLVACGAIEQSSKVLSLKLLDSRARLYCSIVLQVNTFIKKLSPMCEEEMRSEIEIPLSRTEFADIISVSRGHLWKELALFQGQKLLELGYKRILVLNAMRWKKLCRDMQSAKSEKEITELRDEEFSMAA
jgi:CRP-like cAMP-binding protein